MNNRFEFTVMCVNGKYYLYTFRAKDGVIHTDIKEYNRGKDF